jgi:hypothetical protein
MKFLHQPNAERKVVYKYAEEWLQHAVTALRAHFLTYGHKVPEVYVSCGYSPHGFNPDRKINYEGCYMPMRYSADGVPMIYISPDLFEPIQVMFVLAHELIHAVDDGYSTHGFRFRSIARDLGMKECGNVRFIHYVNCIKKFSELAEPLGRYPRGGVTYQNSFSIINPDYQIQRMNDIEFKRNKSIEKKRVKTAVISM